MKRHFILPALVLTLAVAVAVIFYVQRVSLTVTKTVTGSVTDIRNGCWMDGICSVIIDDATTIVTGCGLKAGGVTCATFDQSSLKVGDRVRATYLASGGSNHLGEINGVECESCVIVKLP